MMERSERKKQVNLLVRENYFNIVEIETKIYYNTVNVPTDGRKGHE